VVTVIFLGLVGGLITGISPCVLPVLPVVFLSGGTGRVRQTADGAPLRAGARPLAVVAGLALSFSVFTLLGTIVLDALHVPDDLVHWLGIGVLVVLGLGMIVPALGHLLEKPFSRIPQRAVRTDRSGFVLGLTLGAVYVPCAGPVLAAITVAGATGRIGADTVALTIAFAVGTAVPLLVFAVAGEQVVARVRAFRRHQRAIRVVAGVVVIGLGLGLAFNITDAVQRAIPDYTQALDQALQPNAGTDLSKAGADGTDGSTASRLSGCVAEASTIAVTSLRDCGAAPRVSGITKWLGTEDGAAVTKAQEQGKVVLIDFWAYSCINCQRAIPHVEAWYRQYASDGLIVIGVHTPEYAFEHVPSNVQAGADRLGITYPVAVDDDDVTWNAFGNTSWPADYLIDAKGDVRHVGIGEGGYGTTETMIRTLLTDAHPGVTLPARTDVADTTPTDATQTPETYLGASRETQYGGKDLYRAGTKAFSYPVSLGQDDFALRGAWKVTGESITAASGSESSVGSSIEERYHASDVYLDVGGTGTLTVHGSDGATQTIAVSGAPDIRTVVSSSSVHSGTVTIDVSPGLSLYSLTFG
jgi:cytochrome c biogenesis protein CcdA/thiol-disulfide isomerase/thioredoxin